MFYGQGDIAAMLKEFGTTVHLGDQWEAPGIVSEVDQALLHGEAASLAGRLISVAIETGSLGPDLKEGATIRFERKEYRVYSVYRRDDGALTDIVCLRA
jgi:hypothetical protein